MGEERGDEGRPVLDALESFFTITASWLGVVHEPANNPVEVDEADIR